MRKSKLTALTMAVSMMATAFVGTMTANAEDVLKDKGDVATGIDLVYNETKSTATERYVDVYINGITDIGQLSFKFEVEKKSKTEPIIADSCANVDIMETYDSSLPNGTANNKLQRNANLAFDLYNGAFKFADPYTLFGGGYFGTLKFTVNSADDTFYVKVMSNSSVSTYVNNSLKPVSPSALDELVVPAFATAPVEPEKDEVETARNDFASYADAAVTTFIAGEKAIADVASKTLTWKLTSTEGGVFEKAATVTTDLNGEGSVIFGLMIVNDDAEDFAKIDSAVLVIE